MTDTAEQSQGYQPRRAVRCAGCHEDAHRQWQDSAHATSHLGAYLGARDHAQQHGVATDSCVACHDPLAVGNADHAALDGAGVSCEVCHGIAAVTESVDGAPQAHFELGDNRKFGPYCDAPDHYFHKMGCAPHFERSALCGTCHHLEVQLGDGSKLLAISEFADWSRSEFADTMTCQGCHMPWDRDEAAVGSGRTRTRGHHGDRGPDNRLTNEALALEVEATPTSDGARLRITLENWGAAHSLPAGLPSRRLVIIAGPEQTVVAELGRRLVDADGELAPFYAADHLDGDTRLGPGAKQTFEYELAIVGAASIDVVVYDQSVDSRIAEMWGVGPPERREIIRKTVEIGEQR